MTTHVHITVDTEFNIGGAFAAPHTRRPVGAESVYCEVDGRSEGLGYLLRTLDNHGLRGTFFVEALNTAYFGDAPMGRIAAELHAHGQDVQLHLHPCWTYFLHDDWAERLERDPPNDDITRRSVEEIATLIRAGADTFARWGLPDPKVLRTGGLRVGRSVYQAMRECGLPMASNIGLGVYRPAEAELCLYAECHAIEGIMELPVTTYSDFRLGSRIHHKTLTITGTSWPEMRTLLQRARAAELSDVVILTHPFEFVKHRDATYRELYRDRVNQRRLSRLCAFLAEEPGFRAVTMSERIGSCQPRDRNPLLTVPPAYALGRIIVNQINHKVMRV